MPNSVDVMAEKEGIPKYMGPLGLGDPNDLSISAIEREVHLEPYFEILAVKRCNEEEDRRNRCMAKYGFGGFMLCRSLTAELNRCIYKWKNNPQLVQEGTEVYLSKRSEYRRKGEVKKEDDNVKPLDISDLKSS